MFIYLNIYRNFNEYTVSELFDFKYNIIIIYESLINIVDPIMIWKLMSLMY